MSIFKFLFYGTPFCAFYFFCPHLCRLLNSCMFLVIMQKTLPLFSHLFHILLIELLSSFLLQLIVCLIHNFKYQISFQHFLQCLINISCFYIVFKAVCHILVLHNHDKTHTLLFYWFQILINLRTGLFMNIRVLFTSIANNLLDKSFAV